MEEIGYSINNFFIKFWWLILFIAISPTTFSLIVPGFYGASDDLHIAWLFEMDRSLKSGQFPPRLVPDLSYGFGYPLFNFVFPLPFYLGEAFHVLGLNLVDSIKAVFALSLFASGFAMYFLLREFVNKQLAVVGALIYVYAPYRAVDIYVRGAIGEVVAFIFLPLIILSIIKLTKEKNDLNLKWIGICSLSVGGLILSHNISAYMFIPLALLLCLMKLINLKFSLKPLAQTFLGFSLGLLISIYFWLPAVVDSNLMKYDTVFNFADHFPTMLQLFTPYWGYGASVPGPYDGMSFFLGLSGIFVFSAGIILLLLSWRRFSFNEKAFLIWVIASFFIGIFLMNFRSSFVWLNVPLLPYFQFPWRFLMLTTFLLPLFVIPFKFFKNSNLAGVVLIVLTILISFNYFKPEDFLGRGDEYYLNRYIPYPDASVEYQRTQEEYLRLSKNTATRPEKLYPIASSADFEIKNTVKNSEFNYSFLIESLNSGTLNFNKYFFPGWIAQVNRKTVPISPGEKFGEITVKIPAGESNVRVYYRETTFKILLDIISLVSLIISVLLITLHSKTLKHII